MKRIIPIAIVLLFAACNSNDQSKQANTQGDTAQANQQVSDVTEKKAASIDELLAAYLQIKNALVEDNGNLAAGAAKDLGSALQKMETGSLSGEQKKVYDNVREEIKEHAEHISDNGNKIEHQREHFSWLSDVVYELVKVFKPGQTLYKDRCLMFNDNKGANWLSETREIKNPYYGKKMLTCGVIKEEIK